MTICRKCGKEIPDGEELCDDCKQAESNSGESYLDELIQNLDTEETMEPAASQESVQQDEPDEDINELLKLLSQDYEEEPEDIAVVGEEDSISVSPEELPPENEASLFSDDEDSNIFADGSDSLAVEDVFQDALSAVDYSENEEELVVPEALEREALENSDDENEPMALDPFGLEEDAVPVLEEEEIQSIPVAEPVKKEKKPKKQKPSDSFWKRIFGNIITEQTAEEEAKERELERASMEEKELARKEKKKQEEEAKEEKSELEKAEKDKKAAEKAAKAAEKAAQKEEKKRQKEEAAANEVVGKINPVGGTVVMVFFGLICVGVILGTQTFSYSNAVNTANSDFEEGNYQQAYESIAGINVSESQKENADKIRICMQLQKEMNSYTNYYKMKLYLEALDSLMKGVRNYDTNKAKADQYGIMSQYNSLESKIASTLYSEFGVSETQARNINSTESQEDYTAKLEEIVARWQVKNKEDER